MTLDAQIARLVELRSQASALAEQISDLERDIAQQMTGPKAEVGEWRLERSRRKRQYWDTDGLLSWAGRQRAHPETGEAVPPAELVLSLLREAAGISYWRTGVLRAWGLDPEEWRETEPTGWRVQVSTVDTPPDKD